MNRDLNVETASLYLLYCQHQLIFFMTAAAENPVSHKHVITKVRKTLSDRFEYSYFTSSQGSLSASNMSFREPSEDMSMSCSCSHIVSPETLLAANEL
jgi:hypothetical protein